MPNTLIVTPADPFDQARCFGNEKYSLSNMLLRQVDFPATFTRADFICDVWSDRVYDGFRKACEALRPEEQGLFEDGTLLRKLSPERFLEFVKTASELPEDRGITGARVVRYTNVASGYPVYRFDTFCAAPGRQVAVYSDYYAAPNITSKKIRGLEWLQSRGLFVPHRSSDDFEPYEDDDFDS